MRTTAQFCSLIILMLFLLIATSQLATMQAIQRYVTPMVKEKPHKVTALKSSYSQSMSKPAKLYTALDFIPTRMRRQLPPLGHRYYTLVLFVIGIILGVYVLMATFCIATNSISDSTPLRVSMGASAGGAALCVAGGSANCGIVNIPRYCEARRQLQHNQGREPHGRRVNEGEVSETSQDGPPPYPTDDPPPPYEEFPTQDSTSNARPSPPYDAPPPDYPTNGHQGEVENLGEPRQAQFLTAQALLGNPNSDEARAVGNGVQIEMDDTEAGATLEEP